MIPANSECFMSSKIKVDKIFHTKPTEHKDPFFCNASSQLTWFDPKTPTSVQCDIRLYCTGGLAGWLSRSCGTLDLETIRKISWWSEKLETFLQKKWFWLCLIGEKSCKKYSFSFEAIDLFCYIRFRLTFNDSM